VPASRATLTAIHPLWAVEGGRVNIHGGPFAVDGPELPVVRIGDQRARVVFASSALLGVLVPSQLEGGRTSVRVDGVPGETAFLECGAVFATGLHQVDNPVFDRAGNLYVTYSGSRGQEVPVSIFRVRPDGTRETFASGIVNPTSMAFDAEGRLYVSSRFEGAVYRVEPDGGSEVFAADLGVACGLAFAPDGTLYVGDRSGTVFRVARDGTASTFASLPPSVAAFHLAYGPDDRLYATAPTLSPYDSLFRIDGDGRVERIFDRFGRPQGLAFDRHGQLYVVDALAGASGVFRMTDAGTPELALAGPALVGLAFDPAGGMVVSSNDTVYRLKTRN
jgi:sugar lactone lactonase YvrE